MITFYFVDEDGIEYASNVKPTRHKSEPIWIIKKTSMDINTLEKKEVDDYKSMVELPNGTIKKLFGVELKWQDEPINIEW